MAEDRTRLPLDIDVAPASVSNRIDAVIHGDGYLDFSSLVFESTGQGTADDGDDGQSIINATKKHIHIVEVAVFGYDPDQKEEIESSDDSDSDSNSNSNSSTTSPWNKLGELGLGSVGDDGIFYKCCTTKALQEKACLKKNYGRLIVHDGIFFGDVLPLRFVDQNGKPTNTASFPPGFLGTIFLEGTGHVSVIVGNCNPYSLNLHVHGELVELSYAADNDIPFYIFMVSLHVLLLLWYRILMQRHSDERIKLEEWIFCTICVAALDLIFHMTYKTVIANSDHDVLWLDAATTLMHGFKHGMSRCLYVMVSLGWGVVRETLAKRTMRCLYVLTIMYIVSVSLYDIFRIFGLYEDSEAADHFMVDTSIMVLACDIIFFIWIPFGLFRTMAALRLYRQERKLERYVWLWRIFMFAVVVYVGMVILFIFDAISNKSKDIDELTLERSGEIVYLIVLTCIAYLWRPNPQAKLYSSYQVMESMYFDDEDGDEGGNGDVNGGDGYDMTLDTDDLDIDLDLDLDYPDDEDISGLEMTSSQQQQHR